METSWLNLERQVIVVTGGSSGIGEAIIKELLLVGASVANIDMNEGSESHENLYFIKTDISLRTDVEKAIDAIKTRFGKIDGLVNNAGINIPSLLVDSTKSNSNYELTDAIFDKMTSINQKGVYLVTQAVARLLVQQKSGIIINMSSESGLEGSEGQSCYAATKAAVNSFTRSWSKELGKFNIRVIGIAPGIMEETGLRTEAYESALAYTRSISVEKLRAGYSNLSTIPLGRSGKLSEVAYAVCYFLSEKSGYITGVTVNIAGGKTRG